jgi:hypothetical protein
MCRDSSHKAKKNKKNIFLLNEYYFCYSQAFQMVCEKDLFNHLICICGVKESFVNLSENIDIIELCYMLG